MRGDWERAREASSGWGYAFNNVHETMMTAVCWMNSAALGLQAMASATEHLLAEVWAQGGVRDVYADFNELTLNITTNALFGVDMSSSQAAGISGKRSSTQASFPPACPPPPP